MIRLIVVDDHPIVRQGLASALEDEADFEVVGAVGSAEEALPLVARLTPEVVLLDLELPGIGGVEAIPGLSGPARPRRFLSLPRTTTRSESWERFAPEPAAISSKARPSSTLPGRSARSRAAGRRWSRGSRRSWSRP